MVPARRQAGSRYPALVRSDLETMRLQTAALFDLDDRGRLLRGRDPFAGGREPAPAFFAGRTLAGNLWHVRHDLPDALARQLDDLARSEPTCRHPGQLEAEPAIAPAVRQLLAQHGLLRREHRGPAFYAPETPETPETPAAPAPETTAPTALVRPGDDRLLAGDLDALDLRPYLDAIAPCVVALHEDSPVAVCFSSRTTDRVMEAGVETLPAWRERGYGTAAAARWVLEVRRTGRRPLYSTSWDNPGSRGIARRLGLKLFGENWSFG